MGNNQSKDDTEDSIFSAEDLEVVYRNHTLSEKPIMKVVPRKKSILIIDDDFYIRTLLKELLDREFEVLMAEDGEKGCFMATHFTPDLILLDLQMPKLGGRDTLDRLRLDIRTKSVPVIVLSGTSCCTTLMELLHIGIDEFVAKPVRPLQLLTSVRNSLARSEDKTAEARETKTAKSTMDEAILLYDGKATSREKIRSRFIATGLLSIECQTLKQFRKSFKLHCKIFDGVIYDAKDETLLESFDICDVCDFLKIPCLSVEQYLQAPDAFEKLVRSQGARRRGLSAA